MSLNVENTAELFQRAVELHDSGNRAQADELYRHVLTQWPRYIPVYINLAGLALEMGRSDRAIDIAQRGLSVDAQNADLHCLLATAYGNLRRTPEAVTAYERALAIDPIHPSACNNYANLMLRMGRVSEAAERLETSLAAADSVQQVPVVVTGPGNNAAAGDTARRAFKSAILNNLGSAYLQLFDPEKALSYHRQAYELHDAHPSARSNSLRDMNHLANISPEEILEAHREWWRRHGKSPATPPAYRNARDPAKKLRIGFVSGDLREHSVAHFLMGLFDHLDTKQFEIVAYSESPEVDDFTKRLAARCTLWRRTLGLRDADVAQQILRDEVDILIDLAGHTRGNRLRVFAHRPAPVQMTYLGYPMTTGADMIDWRIADPIADPPGISESHYSEKLLRLPRSMWCYRPPVDLPATETPPSQRGDPKPVMFGSFSNGSKISPMTFDLWAKVVLAVPGSRILIKAMAMVDEGARRHVLRGLTDRGVAADRIQTMARQMKLDEHFLQYENVDVALDTYPYNGTTTHCEALWMNVPVVTLAGGGFGDMHRSRVGASLLTNAGLSQLVAKTPEEFVAIAAQLGLDAPALAQVRHGLRDKFRHSAVMDEPAFAADFAAAMRHAWAIWCKH